MKKLLLIIIMFGAVSSASAARLDVSRLTGPGEFSASFGAAFETGNNNTNKNYNIINAKYSFNSKMRAFLSILFRKKTYA